MPTGPTMPSNPAERYPNLDCTLENALAGESCPGPGGVFTDETRAAAFLRQSAVRVRIPDASFRPHSRNRELPVNASPCDRTDARHFPERKITVNIARAAQHVRLRLIIPVLAVAIA